jgi:hypothetical protein
MTRRSRTRQSRPVEIDGSKCLPFLWTRFSSGLTTKSGGRKLYRDSIINNFVSCSIVGPITHRDVILEIARQSHKAIPIDTLPNNLNASLRGYVVFGFPGNYFDRIAKNYQGMHWWMSESGLNMRVLESMSSNISPFDECAGKRMHEAWLQRLPNGRIPASEYGKICTALDEAGFRPLDFLQGKFRKKLADWNQKNPTKAIHTFCRLFNSKLALPRRGILKRLHRAKSIWINLNKLSAI